MIVKQADELRQSLTLALEWMELRNLQGRNIRADLRRLATTFKGLQKKYGALGPSPRVRRNEPNGLDEIRSRRPAGPRILWEKFDPKLHAQRVARRVPGLRGRLYARGGR